jgi:hypothetical protein
MTDMLRVTDSAGGIPVGLLPASLIIPYNQAVALLWCVAISGTVFDMYQPAINGTAI